MGTHLVPPIPTEGFEPLKKCVRRRCRCCRGCVEVDADLLTARRGSDLWLTLFTHISNPRRARQVSKVFKKSSHNNKISSHSK